MLFNNGGNIGFLATELKSQTSSGGNPGRSSEELTQFPERHSQNERRHDIEQFPQVSQGGRGGRRTTATGEERNNRPYFQNRASPHGPAASSIGSRRAGE